MTERKNQAEMLNNDDLEQVTGGAALSRSDMTETAAYDPQFNGGVRVAAGDVDGNAARITFTDLIVSSYQTGGSHGD